MIDQMDHNCPICTQLPRDCVETACCGNILCKECAKQINKCPMCREENYEYHQSKAMQRIINQQLTVCQYCKKQMTLEVLIKHEGVCQEKMYKCQVLNCLFESNKEDLLKHMINLHTDLLLMDFLDNKKTYASQLSFKSKINAKGMKAQFGSVQKYYCGGKLEGNCQCCNGFCGPNGCNCTACSELDLQFRNLPNKGFLINKNGSICKFDNGRFFCGTQGCSIVKACQPCKALMNQRYKKFQV